MANVNCRQCNRLFNENRTGLCSQCSKVECATCGISFKLRKITTVRQCSQCRNKEMKRKGFRLPTSVKEALNL